MPLFLVWPIENTKVVSSHLTKSTTKYNIYYQHIFLFDAKNNSPECTSWSTHIKQGFCCWINKLGKKKMWGWQRRGRPRRWWCPDTKCQFSTFIRRSLKPSQRQLTQGDIHHITSCRHVSLLCLPCCWLDVEWAFTQVNRQAGRLSIDTLQNRRLVKMCIAV